MLKSSRVVYGVAIGLIGLLFVEELTAQESPSATKPSKYSPERAAERIEAILRQPLKRRLEYDSEQLDIICDELEGEYEIPIVFDKAALDEVAISPESEVSIDLQNISLEAALKLMFKEPGLEDLCFIVHDEVLQITTVDSANEKIILRVYRVDDLLSAMPQRFNEIRPHANPDALIDVLVNTVEMESWAENGTGDGEVQYYAPGMLVISQTRRVHEKIEALFDQMQVTKKRIVEASSGKAAPKEVAATQGFVLDLDFGEDTEQEKKQFTEAIQESVQWSDSTAEVAEGEVWMKVLPDRLLVRHVPMVLAQVETVLWDMNVLDQARHPRRVGDIGIQPLTSGAGKVPNADLAEEQATGDDGN